MRDVPIICGPTAAGKSAIAMALATHVGAMLISADSRQVYRRFDRGTAKPSFGERAMVQHRGIDVAEPTERYSAARWAASAAGWLDEADLLGRTAIIVGGTGFYLRALEEPLFESPVLDEDARAVVQQRLSSRTTDELRAACARVDPARAHLGRTQLLRALEMFELTNRPLSEWLVERARPPEIRGHYLVVDPGAVLRTRIAERVHEMLEDGWEAEIEALARDVPPDAPAWNACGYGELRAAHAGESSRAAAIERTIVATQQYAKRQRTWFRHQLPADRVTLLDPANPDVVARATAWLESVTLSEHP